MKAMVKKRISGHKKNYKKVVGFWLGIIFALLFLSLSVKSFLGFKNSSIRRLHRVNLAFLEDSTPFVLSLEGNSALVVVPGESEKGNNLFVPIFGNFYSQSSKTEKSDKKFFQKLFWQALKKEIKSDLSFFDLMVLLRRSFKINNPVLKITLNDKLGDCLKDSLLRQEALSIEVLNSTTHSGLAQTTALFLENSGLRVVRTADWGEPVSGCRFLVNKNKQSYTLFWLKRVFPCEIELTSEEVSRADISIILGENVIKY